MKSHFRKSIALTLGSVLSLNALPTERRPSHADISSPGNAASARHVPTPEELLAAELVLDPSRRWEKKDPNDTGPYIITYRFIEDSGQIPFSYRTEPKSDNEQPLIYKVQLNYNPLSPALRREMVNAMHEWEKRVNVRFKNVDVESMSTNVRVDDENAPMLKLFASDIGTFGLKGSARYPAGGDGILTVDPKEIHPKNAASRQIIMHEIAHTLGACHPETKRRWPTNAIPTIMHADSDHDYDDSGKPGPYEILALQMLYGKSQARNAQNDPFADNGKFIHISRARDGSVTLHADTPSHNVTLDLNGGPEHFSSVTDPDRAAFLDKTEPLRTDIPRDFARFSKHPFEYVTLPTGTHITKAIGSLGDTDFIGNAQGGSTLVGRGTGNRYLLSGKGNHVVIASDGTHGFYLQPEAQVRMEGPDSAYDTNRAELRDRFIVLGDGPVTASSERSGKDLIVRFSTGASVTLQNFHGHARDIEARRETGAVAGNAIPIPEPERIQQRNLSARAEDKSSFHRR